MDKSNTSLVVGIIFVILGLSGIFAGTPEIGVIFLAIGVAALCKKCLDTPSKADTDRFNSELRKLKEQYNENIEKQKEQFEATGFNDFVTAQEKLDDVNSRYEALTIDYNDLTEEYEKRKKEYVSACKQAETAVKKLERLKELSNAVSHMIERYTNIDYSELRIDGFTNNEIEELVPSVMLQIHSMDSRDLLKLFKENDKTIDNLASSYRARYTTKTNQAIYNLMVIALRAELQNILYDLKYQKLDQGIENVKAVTQKYLTIATGGNQQLSTTMTKFIGELEYLFINAVKIEYNYYIRKEQARQEQLAIRERMKQEAEERRALERERERVEKEEAKFKEQISDLQNKITSAADEEMQALRERLLELEAQLAGVVLKKDEIINLQNGKAGNVYIISNLGSFGENVFKIGMTRRSNPQERIDELGSASVPFGFDVHSFIFSEDAVELENELHKRLNDKRVNKVNMRKEFFRTDLDELERLTHEISPTAEFRRTMAAEEYRRSLSADRVYEAPVSSNETDEVEDDE